MSLEAVKQKVLEQLRRGVSSAGALMRIPEVASTISSDQLDTILGELKSSGLIHLKNGVISLIEQ